MAAEERTERSELEPAQVQLGTKFFCRHESADVGSPVGNARQ